MHTRGPNGGGGTVTVRDRRKRAESCKRRISNDVVRICFKRTPALRLLCGVVLAIKTCSRPLQGAALPVADWKPQITIVIARMILPYPLLII